MHTNFSREGLLLLCSHDLMRFCVFGFCASLTTEKFKTSDKGRIRLHRKQPQICGWCASNRTDLVKQTANFHCKQWRLEFDGSVSFGWVQTQPEICGAIEYAQAEFLTFAWVVENFLFSVEHCWHRYQGEGLRAKALPKRGPQRQRWQPGSPPQQIQWIRLQFQLLSRKWAAPSKR